MKPLAECRLYTFVDTAYLHGRDPVELTRALCEGGSDLIQLRAKGLPKPEVRRMASAIVPVTRSFGVGLVINDYLDIAQETGAEFCHLGQEDFFDSGFTNKAELPVIAGKNRPLLGLSTHGSAQAHRAIEAGADYIAIGPVYSTATKPTANPVTLEYVRWAVQHVRLPWFAIGGITLANLEEVLGAGAERVCVVSAILNQNDVRSAVRAFRSHLR